MTTDELISGLAVDSLIGPRADRSLLAAWLLGVGIVALMFFAVIGFREDIVSALGTVRFLFKFAIVVPVAVLSIVAAFRNMTPISSPRWSPWSLLVPVLLLLAGVLAELIAVPSSLWLTRAVGTNSVHCMTIIPALGAGPLIMLIFALRRGAPADAGLSGALGGLAAGGMAATFYATNCFDDSPLFVITWYPLAIGVLALFGYLAGLRYLRW